MIFDLRSLHKVVKNTPGISCTDSEFLEHSFDPLRKVLRTSSKYGGLSFDKTRVSKILNGSEYLYTSLVRLIEKDDTEEIMLKDADVIVKRLFDDINFDLLINELIKLMNDDDLFDIELKNKINSGVYTSNEIYVEMLLYCLKIENEYINIKNKTTDKNRIKIKRTNPTMIGNIIASIISNKNIIIMESNHKKPWTLQEKMNKNKIERYLQMKIESHFEEYDSVMEIIDALSSQDMMASKYLYSFYENIYYDVLGEVLGDDINEENIASKSTVIFNRVNDYAYKDFMSKNSEIKADYEAIKYHLFAITVTVFYQCHFLLKMEE